MRAIPLPVVGGSSTALGVVVATVGGSLISAVVVDLVTCFALQKWRSLHQRCDAASAEVVQDGGDGSDDDDAIIFSEVVSLIRPSSCAELKEDDFTLAAITVPRSQRHLLVSQQHVPPSAKPTGDDRNHNEASTGCTTPSRWAEVNAVDEGELDEGSETLSPTGGEHHGGFGMAVFPCAQQYHHHADTLHLIGLDGVTSRYSAMPPHMFDDVSVSAAAVHQDGLLSPEEAAELSLSSASQVPPSQQAGSPRFSTLHQRVASFGSSVQADSSAVQGNTSTPAGTQLRRHSFRRVSVPAWPAVTSAHRSALPGSGFSSKKTSPKCSTPVSCDSHDANAPLQLHGSVLPPSYALSFLQSADTLNSLQPPAAAVSKAFIHSGGATMDLIAGPSMDTSGDMVDSSCISRPTPCAVADVVRTTTPMDPMARDGPSSFVTGHPPTVAASRHSQSVAVDHVTNTAEDLNGGEAFFSPVTAQGDAQLPEGLALQTPMHPGVALDPYVMGQNPLMEALRQQHSTRGGAGEGDEETTRLHFLQGNDDEVDNERQRETLSSTPSGKRPCPALHLVFDLDHTIIREPLERLEVLSLDTAARQAMFIDGPFFAAFCRVAAAKGHQLGIASFTDQHGSSSQYVVSSYTEVIELFDAVLPLTRTYLCSPLHIVCHPELSTVGGRCTSTCGGVDNCARRKNPHLVRLRRNLHWIASGERPSEGWCGGDETSPSMIHVLRPPLHSEASSVPHIALQGWGSVGSFSRHSSCKDLLAPPPWSIVAPTATVAPQQLLNTSDHPLSSGAGSQRIESSTIRRLSFGATECSAPATAAATIDDSKLLADRTSSERTSLDTSTQSPQLSVFASRRQGSSGNQEGSVGGWSVPPVPRVHQLPQTAAVASRGVDSNVVVGRGDDSQPTNNAAQLQTSITEFPTSPVATLHGGGSFELHADATATNPELAFSAAIAALSDADPHDAAPQLSAMLPEQKRVHSDLRVRSDVFPFDNPSLGYPSVESSSMVAHQLPVTAAPPVVTGTPAKPPTEEEEEGMMTVLIDDNLENCIAANRTYLSLNPESLDEADENGFHHHHHHIEEFMVRAFCPSSGGFHREWYFKQRELQRLIGISIDDVLSAMHLS